MSDIELGIEQTIENQLKQQLHDLQESLSDLQIAVEGISNRQQEILTHLDNVDDQVVDVRSIVRVTEMERRNDSSLMKNMQSKITSMTVSIDSLKPLLQMQKDLEATSRVTSVIVKWILAVAGFFVTVGAAWQFFR